jgi:hypothetical protein
MNTAPFDAAPAHRALTALVGGWSGTTRTWLNPVAPPDEHPTRATISSLLDGRWIRIDYHGVVMKTPHAGEMIIGFHKDAAEYEMLWIDSFHTGSAMMMSVGGTGPDGEIRVLGSYAAGRERWGWRTVITVGADELVIDAFNISPAGHEDPAIHTRLRRA